MTRLTLTWALVVVLTLTAMWTASPGGQAAFGLIGAAIMLALAGVKAGLILLNFLELRHAPPGWRALFYFYLAATGIVIFLPHAIAPLT